MDVRVRGCFPVYEHVRSDADLKEAGVEPIRGNRRTADSIA